ncbi:MAG: hypothetical protein HZB46_09815 [Solirubrobacterales bacterium]|nr:hypothetical protein [Solirubrobacterales bacterium]
MKLLDRSPDSVMALAFVVVYGVILIEIWMWTVDSLAAVAGTLALVAGLALGIGRWFHDSLTDGEHHVARVLEAAARAEQAEPAEPVSVEAPKRPAVAAGHAPVLGH